MDPNTITTLIGSVGFPVLACLAMAWYVKYITDQNRAEMKAVRDEHKTEITKVTEALNNNTIALQRLCDKMDLERGDLE